MIVIHDVYSVNDLGGVLCLPTPQRGLNQTKDSNHPFEKILGLRAQLIKEIIYIFGHFRRKVVRFFWTK